MVRKTPLWRPQQRPTSVRRSAPSCTSSTPGTPFSRPTFRPFCGRSSSRGDRSTRLSGRADRRRRGTVAGAHLCEGALVDEILDLAEGLGAGLVGQEEKLSTKI